MASSARGAALPGLERVRARLAELARQQVEIGIPASARYPDGTSVAVAAAANEFGTEDIPSRPAIRAGVRAAVPKARALNKVNLPRVLDGRMAASVALAQVGELGVSEVRHAIREGRYAQFRSVSLARWGETL